MEWKGNVPKWSYPSEFEPRYYPLETLFTTKSEETAKEFVKQYMQAHGGNWGVPIIKKIGKDYAVVGGCFGIATLKNNRTTHEHLPFIKNFHELNTYIEENYKLVQIS